MVRVIAGTARGRKLRTIDSEKTKPTLDRVKEAMFSIITPYLPCRNALDLFSGNGSLGIEAMSRGAAYCVLNDYSGACCGIIRENLRQTGFEDISRVCTYDFKELIAREKKKGTRFDLLLLDPPYGKGLVGEALSAVSAAGIYTGAAAEAGEYENACIALAEHSANDILEDRYGVFVKIKTKIYGTVAVSVYEADGGLQ